MGDFFKDMLLRLFGPGIVKNIADRVSTIIGGWLLGLAVAPPEVVENFTSQGSLILAGLGTLLVALFTGKKQKN